MKNLNQLISERNQIIKRGHKGLSSKEIKAADKRVAFLNKVILVLSEDYSEVFFESQLGKVEKLLNSYQEALSEVGKKYTSIKKNKYYDADKKELDKHYEPIKLRSQIFILNFILSESVTQSQCP